MYLVFSPLTSTARTHKRVVEFLYFFTVFTSLPNKFPSTERKTATHFNHSVDTLNV